MEWNSDKTGLCGWKRDIYIFLLVFNDFVLVGSCRVANSTKLGIKPITEQRKGNSRGRMKLVIFGSGLSVKAYNGAWRWFVRLI